MNVRVRLFASYREAAGSALVEIPVAAGVDGPGLWAALVGRHPALRALPPPSGYAVNDEYVQTLPALRESDEVALIPPVSGGAGDSPDDPGVPAGQAPPGGNRNAATHATGTSAPPAAAPEPPEARSPGDRGAPGQRPPLIEITDAPISAERVLREAADPRAGAVVLFLGTVRDNARGRRVRYLTYEAYHALAHREFERITAAAGERWPITRIVIAHRTGRLEVGEISVAVAVSAPHRAAAFDAGRFAIDTLKLTVPIWKKEVWEGGAEWIGTDR